MPQQKPLDFIFTVQGNAPKFLSVVVTHMLQMQHIESENTGVFPLSQAYSYAKYF